MTTTRIPPTKMAARAASKPGCRGNAKLGRRWLVPVITGAITLIWLLPLIWTISLSLRTPTSLLRSVSGFLPIPFSWENYATVLSGSHLPRWFLNSVVVSISVVLLTVIITSLGGYAFARLDFPGKKTLFVIALAGMMIPQQVVLIPQYVMFANLGMHNSYPALILPTTALACPLSLFIMTQFMKAIPKSTDEAARLDGAGTPTLIARIIVPQVIPGMSIVAILTFTGIWNDYLWPLLSSSDPDWMTVTVGIATLVRTTGGTAALGQTLAAAWAASLPIVVFFFIFQKRLVRGIAIGIDEF